MRRLILILSARYPSGALGSVVGFSTLPSIENTGDMFYSPRASLPLSEAIEDVTTLYHTAIGPAYSPEDMVYTIWDVADDQELFDLVGERMLLTDGAVSGIERPEVGG